MPMTTTTPPSPSNPHAAPIVALEDKYHIVVPSALPPLDAEEIMLLRVLGRLELMTIQQIHTLIFPHMTQRGVQYRLNRLVADELLWHAASRTVAANMAVVPQKVKTRGAHVYGLLDGAKALLESMEMETDPLTIGRLRSRDGRGRKPDVRTMSHDLQVSWWCMNVLLSVARSRYCRQVYVQTEFYPEKGQRIDALVMLRLSPNHPRPAEEVGAIPFFDGRARQLNEVDIVLALEVDTGSEQLSIILKKVEKYRDLTRNGVYTAAFGAPVLPVFLVQHALRANRISEQFTTLWPNGWGVVGTPQGVNSKLDGVLWGRYLALTDGAPFPLLTQLAVDAQGKVTFREIITRASWRGGEVQPPKVVLTDRQLATRKGGEVSRDRRRAAKAQQNAVPVEEWPAPR
jgi:Replication-relaxation